MKIIGLTGSIGSGKSTVAAMLREHNIPVIDADELAREALFETGVLDKIRERFGDRIFLDSRTINRKRLGEIVFAHKQALIDLENIIHPEVEKLYNKKLEELKKHNYQVIFYMVPLLFEKNLQNRVDKTLLIIASEETLLERIAKRDSLTKQEARLRLRAQMSNEEKISKADEIIENNGTVDELFCKLKLVCSRLCNIILS